MAFDFGKFLSSGTSGSPSGSSGSSGNSFDGGFGGGLGGAANLLDYFFGSNPGDAYKKSMEQYKKYFDKAAGYQEPFYESGKNALPGFEEWLGGMKDPSDFINQLMGNYEESPYAKYLQEQAMRAGNNFGSASGLTGSTALLQQMQENAGGIASKDQQDWLKNVLGINETYGSGLNNLIGKGMESGNNLSSLYSKLGELMGDSAFGKELGRQKKNNSLWSGLGGLATGIGAAFL